MGYYAAKAWCCIRIDSVGAALGRRLVAIILVRTFRVNSTKTMPHTLKRIR